MLPNVNLVANENFTVSAFQQKLANGSEFISPGAPFNNANAGVQLSWTLFDGRRMHITKNRLEQTEVLGQLNLQNAVQSTIANVLVAYYEIVRGAMQERALAEVILLNEERLRIAEARLAAGFAAPVGVALAWMGWQGALPGYWQQVWVWGAGYSRETMFVQPWLEGARRGGGGN